MASPVTRSGIYMRVSKDDGSQDTDNQLLVLKEEIEHAGEELVEVYVDYESGTRGRRERAEFDRMFKDAERRRFDLLCVDADATGMARERSPMKLRISSNGPYRQAVEE